MEARRPPGCSSSASSPYGRLLENEVEENRDVMPNPGIDPSKRASAAANAITRLHREHYGRGAVSSHTVIQRDYVVVFLRDIYTPVERTLIDSGQQRTVRETRQAFQDAMTVPFSEAIEEVMGRKVIAFMSQVCFDPDMAAEIFVLEPDGTPS